MGGGQENFAEFMKAYHNRTNASRITLSPRATSAVSQEPSARHPAVLLPCAVGKEWEVVAYLRVRFAERVFFAGDLHDVPVWGRNFAPPATNLAHPEPWFANEKKK